MKIFKGRIKSTSIESIKILQEAELGDWVHFQDCDTRIDPSAEHCCINCIYWKEQNDNTSCPHFTCCSANHRKDGRSVYFVDEAKLLKKRETARRSYHVHKKK